MSLRNITVLDVSYSVVRLVYIIEILTVVSGLLFYKKMDSVQRALFYFMCLMGSTEVLNYIAAYMVFGSNRIVFPYYCLAELGFIIWLCNAVLLKKPNKWLLFAGFTGVFYILCEAVWFFIINSADRQSFQPLGKVVVNFVVIISMLSYFYTLTAKPETVRWRVPQLAIVVLLFFGGTFIIWLPFDYMVNSPTDVKFYFWTYYQCMIALFYGYICLQMFYKTLLYGRHLNA